MLRFIVLIMLVSVATGCRSVKPSTETIHTVKDSSWTEVKYHKKDTTITIPGAVSYITVPISTLTETPIKNTSGHSTVSVKRTGDVLEVVCECAEYKQRIAYLETEITHLHKIIELHKQLKTEPYPFVPWTIKILAWIGGIALGAIGLFVGWKFFLR